MFSSISPRAGYQYYLLTTASILALLCCTAYTESGRIPCHRTRSSQGDGQESCDRYVMPKKLCVRCKLRDWKRPNGDFTDCSNIYDVTAPKCLAQLQRYVERNPCDKLRASQMSDPYDDTNREGLDYFLYSICEECCDCVPMGSKVDEFADRKRTNSLIKVDRGNCPAHARADICKVWPNVRAVSNKYGKIRDISDDVPPVCPLFRQWLDSSDGRSWYNKAEVNIPNAARNFLTNLTYSVGCTYKRPWSRCVRLESDLKRV